MPVVSHRVTPLRARARRRSGRTSRARSSTGTSPSIGQPNDARQRHVDRHRGAAAPARSPRRAARTTARASCAGWSGCGVSLADITRLNSSTRASIARSAPRTFGHQRGVDDAGLARDVAHHRPRRRAAPGMAFGDVNEVTSIFAIAGLRQRVRPARSCRRSARRPPSIWRPSRVPTSCMWRRLPVPFQMLLMPPPSCRAARRCRWSDKPSSPQHRRRCRRRGSARRCATVPGVPQQLGHDAGHRRARGRRDVG